MALIVPSFFSLLAQKHDYIWEFGRGEYADSVIRTGGTEINFNYNPVRFSRIARVVDFVITSAVISNEEGQLKYYTNGCRIYNHLDEVVMGGDSINFPSLSWTLHCSKGWGYVGSQTHIFIRHPGNDNQYLLFHQDVDYINDPKSGELTSGSKRIYYSLIDDSLPGGHLIEKNQLLLEGTFCTSCVTAVKHENLQDWWILTIDKFSNAVYKFLLDENGVHLVDTQYTGLPVNNVGSASGQTVFTPNGSKFLHYNPHQDLQIWDFDRETGHLSNHLHIAIEDSANLGGVAVSSNSRFAYVSSQFDLYQFDLMAQDIPASKVVVAHYDYFFDPFPPTFKKAQLAPDCRIYLNTPNGDQYLHVIHHPNRKGIACEVEQHGIYLPTTRGISLPIFPNYRLGTAPVCDSSLQLTPVSDFTPLQAWINLYPNPSDGQFVLESMDLSQDLEVLEVYDQIGKKVYSTIWSHDTSKLELNLDNSPPGMYYALVRDSQGRAVYSEKFVIAGN